MDYSDVACRTAERERINTRGATRNLGRAELSPPNLRAAYSKFKGVETRGTGDGEGRQEEKASDTRKPRRSRAGLGRSRLREPGGSRRRAETPRRDIGGYRERLKFESAGIRASAREPPRWRTCSFVLRSRQRRSGRSSLGDKKIRETEREGDALAG